MTISLPIGLASGYQSASQVARIVTEAWALANLYCPRCEGALVSCAANTRTKDFDCARCDEHFQLKSCTKSLMGKLTGAEYGTTLASIQHGRHPSLILLRYAASTMTVIDVQFVHKACITPGCLVPRKPLRSSARRAGWQGSMLNLDCIPAIGRVDAVRAGESVPREDVQAQWATADRILREPPKERGWTAEVLRVVEQLPTEFRLADAYQFADELATRYPNNRNVRPKIRQQLQVLRDLGFIAFTGRGGVYRKVLREGVPRTAV